MGSIIEVQGVSKSFGALNVINDCSIAVEEGSITGLIGPNGAGKSTLFNLIAGTFPVSSGTIRFDGEDITNIPSNELFSKGLLRTFQIAQEFTHMTALENLMMVPPDQPGENLFNTWFRPKLVRSHEADVRQRALEVIDFIGLSHVKNELAGNLSGGQKKLLELGRTMMVNAKVVLLDEIAAGVNRTLLQDLVANIQRLNQEMGYTFLVIEHDMDMIAELCDPIIVLAQGSVMVEGTIEEIQNNPQVIEAYFGSDPNESGAANGTD
ncbi:ABC transporter ATP-binding protein [Saccharospirillum salsuginis]|uniref:ABC transporter ATP-binding protein n=1 Tax=Saccharospirillum salsuginis TaxID=418750 RepID=A0A918KJY5_9GAMM|nr:ABC transporter ATP-binding protein [Saccharospirillum salsuginis]GGX64059.1 ABC transporter ATP-binding protein [Saccharospirillum salsuginis]